jgi:hypothetical protein
MLGYIRTNTELCQRIKNKPLKIKAMYKDLFEVKKLKTELYKGAIKEIAIACNKSYSHVYDVLRGRYEDINVIEIAAEKLKEYNEKKQRIQEKLNQNFETIEQLNARLNRQREKYGVNSSPIL